MRFVNIMGCLFFMFFANFCIAQNAYNQQKEYGLKGKIKKVSTYMVYPSKYQIPADTLGFFRRNVMKFTKNGDLISQEKRYDLPNYFLSQKMKFSGTGKNISYKETSVLNDLPAENQHYIYKWTDALSYEIISTNPEVTAKRMVYLNADFTIKQVIYKANDLQTQENVTYVRNENNQLTEVRFNMQITKENETTFIQDIQKIQAVDVFDNPTVLYYYESEESRVPKTVIFNYYEYY